MNERLSGSQRGARRNPKTGQLSAKKHKSTNDKTRQFANAMIHKDVFGRLLNPG